MLMDKAALKRLQLAIESVDWGNPETRDANGRGSWSLRFQNRELPFTAPAGLVRARPPGTASAAAANNAEATRAAPGFGAMGADPLVEGPASSTSQDWFGTEMSLPALTSMAAQMSTGDGIPLLPRHNYGMFGASVEWDEVIGRTSTAVVTPVEAVANAAAPEEQQYILMVGSSLYADDPRAQNLSNRVNRGEPIGQSIGGWFTHLRIVEDDEGEVTRMIALDVELDHLAITRAPANPDAMGLVMRSAVQEMVHNARGAKPPKATVETERAAAKVEVEVEVETDPEAEMEPEVEPEAAPGTEPVEDSKPGDGDNRATTETEYKTHKPIQKECARVENSKGRITLSFDASADDAALLRGLQAARSGDLGPDLARVFALEAPAASIPAATEAPQNSRDAAATSDASGVASPENDMDPAVLRQILAESLAPVTARLDALESRSAPTPGATPADTRAAPAPAPAATPGSDADVWRTRAENAERALEQSARSKRSGIAVPLNMDARSGDAYDEMIERARVEAPNLAAAAASFKNYSFTPEADEKPKSTHELTRSLSAVLSAAVDDGVVKDPFNTPNWS